MSFIGQQERRTGQPKCLDDHASDSNCHPNEDNVMLAYAACGTGYLWVIVIDLTIPDPPQS